MLSDIDDEHANAFFRIGDEGRYEGGPADSLTAAALDLDKDENVPDSRQLERRARFRWLVGAIVGTLAISSIFLFSVGAVLGDSASFSPESEAPATNRPPKTGSNGSTEQRSSPARRAPHGLTPWPAGKEGAASAGAKKELAAEQPPARPKQLADERHQDTQERVAPRAAIERSANRKSEAGEPMRQASSTPGRAANEQATPETQPGQPSTRPVSAPRSSANVVAARARHPAGRSEPYRPPTAKFPD